MHETVIWVELDFGRGVCWTPMVGMGNGEAFRRTGLKLSD